MADNNRFEENQGPQQGNTSSRKDLGEHADQQKSQFRSVGSEDMEDDIRPADARDMRDENTKIGLINDPEADRSRTSPGEPRTGNQSTQPMKDQGNMGKEGSMREQLRSKEGYRNMDEDENADDSLKKGDNLNDTLGNP